MTDQLLWRSLLL